MKTNQTYPISKYIGKHPNGEWIFIKDFEGTYEEAINEAKKLQELDPQNRYSLWDDR